jgi:hypothetical protein
MSSSCGCSKIKHGDALRSKDMKSSLIGIHTAMLRRLRNKKDPNFSNYGGRGLKIYKKWVDYKTFRDDVTKLIGPRKSGMTLERINNNRGYFPKNIRWATQKEQLRNKRTNHLITFRRRTLCLTDWALEIGMSPLTLGGRLKAGWSVRRAITEPVLNKHRGIHF